MDPAGTHEETQIPTYRTCVRRFGIEVVVVGIVVVGIRSRVNALGEDLASEATPFSGGQPMHRSLSRA